MKQAQIGLNLSISVEMNVLRLRRWINRHLSRKVRPRFKSGDRRYNMAYRANARRYAQDRLFKFNAFRNPRGRRR